MVAVNSTMLPLGTSAPHFNLPDTEGKQISLDHFPSPKGYLIMFICNHCPYVKHLHPKLSQVANSYLAKGFAVFAINSNDPDHYPEDAPAKMIDEAQRLKFKFPYLFDRSQTTAKAYHAACTPDFFVFDANKKLTYRGQFDDSRPGNNKPVSGQDLINALESTLTHSPIPESQQKPSIGCNIKWTPGNEPPYFK